MVPDLSKLMSSQLKTPLKSGLIFWTGGFLAWVSDKGVATFYKWYIGFTPLQISLSVFLVLLVMAFSAALIANLDIFVLRLLEGYYWPKWLRTWWIRRQDACWVKKARNRFDALAQKDKRNEQSLTHEERREYAALDRKLMHLPDFEERLPTMLGNILRTAELRPMEKYGLDAFICFPRLWLVMPKEAKDELSNARKSLDNTTHIWIWSFLFMFWGILALWAVPVGLVLTVLAYRWMLRSADIYGQLVESVFDVYRPLLYQYLRWPLPENPAEEHDQGEKLTAYLWRGSDKPLPAFTEIHKQEKT